MNKLNIAIFGVGAVGQCLGHELDSAGHKITFMDDKGEPCTKVAGKTFLQIDKVSIEDNGETTIREKLDLTKLPEKAEYGQYDLIFITVGYSNIPDVSKTLKRKLKNAKTLPTIIFLENYYEPEKLFLSNYEDYPEDKLVFGIPDIISYRVEENYTRTLYPFTFIIGNKDVVEKLQDKHFEAADEVKTRFLQRLCSHNTAHNMLAYLGHAKQYKHISEAIADEEIKSKMIAALEEGAHGLVHKYGVSPEHQKKKIEEEVNKLYVTNFTDPIRRVARTPIKKLNPYERFALPALMAYDAGVFPEALCEGMAYLFLYHDPEDSECVALAAKLEESGLEKALEEYSGIAVNHPVSIRVKEIYMELAS